VADLGKNALVTPLYISVAWIMLVSYQLFTQKAVDSVVHTIAAFWPSIGRLMIARMAVMVFMHAFAWVFVLSSLIPSVILGKERSVLIQFLVCLTLAFVTVSFADILPLISVIPFFPYLEENSVEQIFRMVTWLEKPWLAGLYLSAPSLVMLCIDLCERRKKSKIKLMKIEEKYKRMLL